MHWDSWGAVLDSQSWEEEGSLGTAHPCLLAAGSTGGTGSRAGSLSTGACGGLGLVLQWLFLPDDTPGAPARFDCMC